MAWLSSMFKSKDEIEKETKEGAETKVATDSNENKSITELTAEVAALQAELASEKAMTERAARDERQLQKALRQLLVMAEAEAPAAASGNDKQAEAQSLREQLRSATTKAQLEAVVDKCEAAGLKHEAELGRKKLGKM
jgi:hypothetical protein